MITIAAIVTHLRTLNVDTLEKGFYKKSFSIKRREIGNVNVKESIRLSCTFDIYIVLV